METLLTLATVLCTDTQPGRPLCSSSSNTGIPALVCPSSPQQLPLINLILDQLQPNMKRNNSPPLPPPNILLSDFESTTYSYTTAQQRTISVLCAVSIETVSEWLHRREEKREKNSQIHAPVLAQHICESLSKHEFWFSKWSLCITNKGLVFQIALVSERRASPLGELVNDETGHSKTRGYINRNVCNGDSIGGFRRVVMQRVSLCCLSCRSLNFLSHTLSKLLQHFERKVWNKHTRL